MDFIDKKLFFLNKSFKDCYECVSFIGNIMEENQIATSQYTHSMVELLDKFKGVIVLEDGFALAHARPEQGVLKTGLVFVQLSSPLDFFNPDFEKVKFVIGMASIGSDEHIQLIQKIANLIDNDIQHQNFKNEDELFVFLEKHFK